MRRFLRFYLVLILSALLTGLVSAESVRIGVSSGADMLPGKFNPSFNFQATPNAPTRSVNFTVQTADQGLQAAGDTCATNPQTGASTSGFQMAHSGDWTGPHLPNLQNDNWGFGGQTDSQAGLYLTRNSGWMPFSRATEGWDSDDPTDLGDGGQPPVVPEPSTMLVLGIGLAAGALPLSRRFRRQK